jgi:hypothetical protein
VKATGHTQTLHIAVAVALVLALAQTAVAGTQAKGDRKPAELWKTYPLDPTRGETPTLGGIQTETGSGERPRAGSHAPIASSAPPESHESRTILFAIIGATLVAGLAAAALAIVNRPAATPSAGAGDVKETLAGYGYYVSVEESKSSRSPPSTMPPFRPSPTKKGSSMVNFRRGSDEQAGVVPERPPEAGEPEENEAVPSALEMSAFASFGDEVQTILDSAQEAAAKIRGRAEDEAEEIHNAAAAAAEAERAEAARLAETSRADAERLRSEAEAYAHETRTAAEEAAERRRSEVEAEAGRILDEAKQRRDAIDAELVNGVEHAEEQTRQRIGTLQGEIQRQEERLESIAVVLRSMATQVTELLEEGSDNLSDDLANLTGKAVEGS